MVALNTRTAEDLILDACDDLMVRYGFRKMSMDDVARKAGVSRRTVYNFFANKEDLGLRSIGRVVDEVIDDMVAMCAESAPVDHRLAYVLEQRVMGRLRRVKNYASSLDELFEAVRPAYMARRKLTYERERDMIKNLLIEGVEKGVFRAGSEVFAGSMIHATNAFIPYSLSPEELGNEDEVFAQLEVMIRLQLSGVLERRGIEE